MNIQNNRAAEVLYSTTYVEDYLDTVENLPDEVQRLLSRLTVLDSQGQTHFEKIREYFEQLVRLKQRNGRTEDDDREVSRVYGIITVTLIKSQEIGDEKIQVAQQIQDFVDNRLRQLEVDRKTLDSVQKQADAVEAAAATTFPTRERDSHPRLSSSTDTGTTSDRAVKRVRRVRLGPSIIPNKPTTVTSAQSSANNDRRSESFSLAVPPIADPSSSVASNVPATHVPEKDKPKEKVKVAEQNRASSSGSSGQDSRRDSASVSLSAKKRVSEVEVPINNASQTANAEPSTSERKTDHGLRTPKKKEKKIAIIQKPPERKASSGSTSSSTKRTAAKRKVQQDGPMAGADPDEATYCVCVQISYGDMIACDNSLCPIEWFHFSCVQLTAKPKGKWYCPTCRDGNANVMKPKEVILKELEQYNREREGR